MHDSDSDDKTQTYLQLAKDTIVGHYRIIDKIGAGGMGEVYLAEDTKLNRKVALKFLPAHACRDADCRARFTREAQAAAKLDHPNIVAVHEVGEFNGRPFFSMQYVEGRSLKETLSGTTVPLDRVIDICIQICAGLQMAHEQGVTHRDIKPTNILIDPRGRARIVDFGLVSMPGFDKLTKTGTILGTVGYMSPEQARGDKLDHRTDLFSLGIVLYEMITGHSPFKADSEAATLNAITNTKPELLARFRREIPSELQTIVDKALEKDVATRYQHADEIAADLKRLTSRVSSGVIPGKRKRQIVVPALLLLILAVAVLVTKPWQLVIPPGQKTAPPEMMRVVVVPFKNETGDRSLDPIGTQVAGRTSQGLMLLKHVVVVQPDAHLLPDTIGGIRSIAKVAVASRVVTGVYYKIGDSIQFQAQVSDSAERLLAPVKPISVLISRFTDGVEEVRQRVMGAIAFGGVLYRAPLYDAYLQYEQGTKIFTEKNDYAGSIPYFKRALEIDSGFNSPLLNLFGAYFNLGLCAQADSILKILEARRSQLSEFQTLGLNRRKAQLAGDWMGALKALRSGIKEFPFAVDWFTVGRACLRVNFPNEAIEAFKRVNVEGTWEWYWTNFAEAYHILGDHEKELEIIREGRRRFPTEAAVYNAELQALAATGSIQMLRKLIGNRPGLSKDLDLTTTPGESMRLAAAELRAHGHEEEAMKFFDEAIRWYEAQPPERLSDAIKGNYALTLYCARRWEKARLAYQELATKSPKDSEKERDYSVSLGLIAARQDDRTKAMEVSEWLKELKVPYLYGEPTYQRARIAAILGDKAQAVALLKQSCLQGVAYGIAMHSDFDLEALWNYPPFIEFLKPKG